MTASLLFLAATSLAAPGDRARFVVLGGDPAPGLLVNETPGFRPFDPADPTRPTLVFIHGVNPIPRLIRYSMARRLGEALARRGGPPRNVLGWDWNGAARGSVVARIHDENAISQGRRLAASLLAAGVPPGRIHLIGQSSGAIVAASAASDLRALTGQPVGQVTLLDPATPYHDVVFERLAVATNAQRVENVWAAGPSGFGRAVGFVGVSNVRVDAPAPWLGAVDPRHSAHLHVVRWYIATVENPSIPGGFNTSAFAAGS